MRPLRSAPLALALSLLPLAGPSAAPLPTAQESGSATPPRARDLGVPFDGTPVPLNAITDVDRVEDVADTQLRAH